MVDQMIKRYNRLDVLVYNSGAIWWASVENTPMKRFQLMQKINPEGLYGTIQATLPHFYKNGSDGKGKGRIVVISPPIYSRFLKGKTAYAMGKVGLLTQWSRIHVDAMRQFGMSALTIGLAVDFERENRSELAITSLWPAAVREHPAH
jgi:NAD(P)-dependent dehydrogenase (short-subunit alcohol dehydrogenase family)